MDRRTGYIVEELYRLGPMSNQELSKHLALSPASITHLLQPLVYHGILKERPPEEYPEDLLDDDGDDGRKRRRKITVTPNQQYGYVISGEVTDNIIHFRKIDFALNFDETFQKSIELDVAGNFTEQIVQTIRQIKKDDPRKLLAIGFTVAGRVDHDTQRLILSTTLGYLRDKDFASELRKQIGVPTILFNDANALSLFERYAGKARNTEHFFSLFMNEGVGIGIFANGHLYEGFKDQAGETGHWIIDPKGPDMNGIPRGSLEAYVSQAAIANQLRQAGFSLEDHEAYRVLYAELVRNPTLPRTGPSRIALVTPILDSICDRISQLCTNLLHVFSPEKIFVYGPMADVGDIFLSRVREGIRKLTLPQRAQALAASIELSDDWRRSMAMGAAKRAIDAYIEHLVSTWPDLKS